MLSNCKISLYWAKVWCSATTCVIIHFFLLPSLLFYISLSLFSVMSMQNEFNQASGQLLSPGSLECSLSWEAPGSNGRGFVCPRILSGKPRLGYTAVIAVG